MEIESMKARLILAALAMTAATTAQAQLTRSQAMDNCQTLALIAELAMLDWQMGADLSALRKDYLNEPKLAHLKAGVHVIVLDVATKERFKTTKQKDQATTIYARNFLFACLGSIK